MLKKINEGGVESDTGFSIQIINAGTLEYCEGDKAVHIAIGYNRKTREIFVHASEIKSWSASANTPLSESKKNEIIQNIEKSVALLKDHFVVV